MQEDILLLDKETRCLYETLAKTTNILTGTRFTLPEVKNIAAQVKKINQLKKEKNALILAHYYCTPQILFGVADFCGDSYALAKKAKEAIDYIRKTHNIGRFIKDMKKVIIENS